MPPEERKKVMREITARNQWQIWFAKSVVMSYHPTAAKEILRMVAGDMFDDGFDITRQRWGKVSPVPKCYERDYASG